MIFAYYKIPTRETQVMPEFSFQKDVNDKALIMAIEGSVNYTSVALIKKNITFDYINKKNENNQAGIIIPIIKKILGKNNLLISDLLGISVGCGPGSFTGLRAVLAAAQGIIISQGGGNINSSRNFISIGINSLAALALSALEEAILNNVEYIISIIDTRRDDVFFQIYCLNFKANSVFPIKEVNEIEICKIDEFSKIYKKHKLKDKKILVIGHQSFLFIKHNSNIIISKQKKQIPSASWVGKMGYMAIFNRLKFKESLVFSEVKPIYIRSPEIN